MKFLLNSYRLSHYVIGLHKEHLIPKNVASFDDNNQHRIFTVEWPDGKRWFVKQPYDLSMEGNFGINNESEAIKRIAKLESLNNYSPGLILYDRIHKILITDYLLNYQNLSEIADTLTPGLLENRLFEEMGAMMAKFHSDLTLSVKTSSEKWNFCSIKPPTLMHNISSFNASVTNNERLDLKTRKSFTSRLLKNEVATQITSLNNLWKSTNIIHGDANFYNILVSLNQENIENIVLCDWEFAGWGDPDWDTSCIFRGLLNAYMKMYINYSMLISAGENYYKFYQAVDSDVSILPFELWIKKILRLAAIGLLERLLLEKDPNTNIQTINSEISGEKVQFLIEVLLDPLKRTSI